HYKSYAKGTAPEFALFLRVAGINHTRDGMAVDQFDAVTALVKWVVCGQAPDNIIATARGVGNPRGLVNTELLQDYVPDRTRTLCPY
ncbi:tannase/feruloyl esterase family alpha/beta hydrolase, partial [Acinetobacter baumannii]|uniref:tannase/feruloyl esterase family alpha/beta hydrolase n=1 Tax=Acinetobacter baumannii TaxID=470 RepID=UPI0009AA7DC4